VKEGVALEFYSPSEKIKLMRKKFRINQADLESVNMTRAFISMMESGKRNVSKASSGKLVLKFKELAMKISVTLDIDDEYFSRQPKDDARLYIEKELIKNNEHTELDKLIKIAIDFEIYDLLSKIYEMKAEKFLAEKEFINAFIHFNLALGKLQEIRPNSGQALLYKQLGVCKERLGEYIEAIYYFKQAIEYSLKENNMLMYFKSSRNLSIAYAKSAQYSICIQTINENIFNAKVKASKEILVDARIIKATALSNLNDDSALKEYLTLVEEVGDTNDLVLSILYNNISEFYYRKDDYKKSLEYANKAHVLKSKVNRVALPNTLNVKGKVFLKLGLVQEGTMMFDLAASIAEENKTFDMFFENYKALMSIYDSKEDLKEVMKRFEKLLLYKKCIL
jgi:tetratricopeptide (TPR) repeat protein